VDHSSEVIQEGRLKSSYSRRTVILGSLIGLLAGIAIGITLASLRGDSQESVLPVDSNSDDQLIALWTDEVRNDLKGYNVWADCPGYNAALVTALANLLAHPEAENLDLELLAQAFRRGSGEKVTLSGQWLALVYQQPCNLDGRPDTSEHVINPDVRAYVINNDRQVWEVARGEIKLSHLSVGTVALVDRRTSRSEQPEQFALVHIAEWPSGGWYGKTLIEFQTPGMLELRQTFVHTFAAPVLAVPIEEWQFTFNFIRVSDHAPCDFGDRLHYILSIEEVALPYEYTGKDDSTLAPQFRFWGEMVGPISIVIEERLPDGSTVYRHLNNWRSYCQN
jgi:hypothetical protein